MNRSLSLILTLSIAALLTSCAYENDPGLQPKPKPSPKPAVNDVLKGKSSAEVLNLKYKNLKASCELTLVTVPPTPAQDVVDTLPAPQDSSVTPPAAPITNDKNKTAYDLKAQLAVDPRLEKSVEAVMVEAQGATELTLKLNVKPVLFIEGLNLKKDKLVYVMKYTPALTFEYTYTEQNTDTRSSVKGTGSLNENIISEQVLKSVENADKSIVNHVLKCELKSEVNTDNKDVEGQWLKIDCGSKPEPGKEAEHAAHCKEAATPEAVK